MDSVDIKILNCLKTNARASASEMAEKVNLSISAVIERIKKLENNGVIQNYTIIIDYEKLNKDVVALVTVTMEHPKFNQGFIEDVNKNSHISECHLIAGDYDFNVKIITENTKSLERVLNEIKCIEGVAKIKTNLVLATYKSDLTSPIRIKKAAK